MDSVANSSIEDSDPTAWPEAFAPLLRVVLATLPVTVAAVVEREGVVVRVLASQGRDEKDWLAPVLESLLQADPAEPSFGIHGLPPFTDPAGISFASLAPIGSDGLMLVALGALLSAEQRDILADLARLAAVNPRGSRIPLPHADATHVAFADALEALPEAIAVFDEEDRFLLWNSQFAAVYAGRGVALRVGLRFEDHLRASVAAGHVPAARGCEEAWLAGRLARFHAAEGAVEHQLGDGRWVRVQDRRLPHGGKVGIRSDITALVEREQSFRVLFDANPAPMLVIDREGLQILAGNDAALAFYGYSRAQLLALTLPDIRPERVPGEIRAMIERLDDPTLADIPRLHRTADGSERIVRVDAQALAWAGRPAILAAMFDITAWQRSEEEIRRTRGFLQQVVDNVPTAVFVKDMWDEGRYVLYNRAGEAMVDRASASIIGRGDREVFAAADAERFIRQDVMALRRGSVATIDEEQVHLPDGSSRWIRTRKIALPDGAASRPRYVLGVSEDITDQRASAARFAHMAHHDALTDLPNRFLLCDRLASALARLGPADDLIALLCIDLDGFKVVNDAFGHAAGDSLLRCVGERLREVVRASDTAARLGGDEFVVMQAPVAQMGEAAWLAGRLVSLLSKPYRIDGRELRVGASIGVALAPGDGVDVAALLAQADAALYQAKREGRNRFRFADPTANRHAEGPPRKAPRRAPRGQGG